MYWSLHAELVQRSNCRSSLLSTKAMIATLEASMLPHTHFLFLNAVFCSFVLAKFWSRVPKFDLFKTALLIILLLSCVLWQPWALGSVRQSSSGKMFPLFSRLAMWMPQVRHVGNPTCQKKASNPRNQKVGRVEDLREVVRTGRIMNT